MAPDHIVGYRFGEVMWLGGWRRMAPDHIVGYRFDIGEVMWLGVVEKDGSRPHCRLPIGYRGGNVVGGWRRRMTPDHIVGYRLDIGEVMWLGGGGEGWLQTTL